MARHRLEPTRRVHPRYGRILSAGLSVAVTMVALLGFVGLIPLGPADSGDQTVASSPVDAPANGPDSEGGPEGGSEGADTAGASLASSGAPGSTTSRSQTGRSVSGALEKVADPADLPVGSGQGRRVVFSESAQRVWLVDGDGSVAATYLVSGSVTDNLQPGKYDVFSRSRWAVGIDDSGVMEYFVRFANGPNAAIGFHSIPTKNGEPLQTEEQLGTPQSHGCIRQKMSDAELMWDFAGTGTDVVVVA